ncbi:IL11 protein, partial [Pelecanoides urinatrix]|nr:IL11 protein [Pelecanoides urinatrix]
SLPPKPFPRPRVVGVVPRGAEPTSRRQKSRFPAEGEHKLDSLPVLSMSALELANIQVGDTDTSGGGEKSWRGEFGVLRSSGCPWVRGSLCPWGAKGAWLPPNPDAPPPQLSRLSLPRPSAPQPPLPAPGSPWLAVQAGHALFHSLHLYLDWASRALVL